MIEKIQLTALLIALVCYVPMIGTKPEDFKKWVETLIVYGFVGGVSIALPLTFYRIWA